MRRLILPLAAATVAGAALWLFAGGGAQAVAVWAAGAQREAQNALARAIRSLQAGEAGALLALWTLAFAYGFAHAAGPGHGKLVLGAYGIGGRAGMGRLALLALLSALAQGLTAVLLVAGGLWLLGWGRAEMEGIADTTLLVLSNLAIGALGLFLVWRGLRGLGRVLAPAATAHPPATRMEAELAGLSGGSPGGPEVCATCGHAHGPTLDQARAVAGWREGAALVAAIAVRPCTGALFLLLLTFRIGAPWAGIGGVLAMALGTASVTLAVALAAVTLHKGALARLPSGGALARGAALAEVAGGALIVALAAGLIVAL